MIVGIYQGPGETGDVMGEIGAAAGRAAAAGASLLVCPEMITTGYHIGARTAEVAEPADGPTARRIAGFAADAGLAIAYGYPERDGGTVHNSAMIVGAHGERLANYRKTHLFGDIDRTAFSPGEEAVVRTEIDGIAVGVVICYDVEFPELVRAHALAGTELLVVPTALMRPYELVADTLVPTRAYESQLFVAYANRCDVESELDYCGRSSVVAPTGAVLAKAGGGPELILATVDSAVLRASRAENTHLTDRRPELYDGEHQA
ncbi:carbon-nitrogen hydrolase family protein [Amycolatopsis sp. CA-230715]|uniref:carbon-nitrogen hydrolase family protein n=1 Tax=Amycolatopsis sp. CA-230715 TaxID=2745196 RepID=UPI001C016602|nr:carbon-nitrogen hydrolase family protein [Amycolatopsis sp. CA-230715]QWF78046.1 (R)-stereoselective amidase [Amycolatopsis sp. CA-230715]